MSGYIRTFADDKAEGQAETDLAIEKIMKGFREAQRTPVPDLSSDEALRMRCFELVLEREAAEGGPYNWDTIRREARKIAKYIETGF